MAHLEVAGFTADPNAVGEICYTRQVSFKRGQQRVLLPHTYVKVYTTIPHGDISVRACGKDAIRVVSVYDGGGRARGRAIAKDARVFRVGTVEDIIARTLQRARDVWKATTERPRCNKCGTVTFEAKSGRNVCAAICWEHKAAAQTS